MTELKPCPFCGGAGRILTHLTEDKFTIECLGCGMRLRWFRSGEEAMESWNSRVTDWHTGTPTEEGLYLVLLDGHYHKDTTAYTVALWSNSGWRMTIQGTYYNLEEKVISWQRIEPFKEETE